MRTLTLKPGAAPSGKGFRPIVGYEFGDTRGSRMLARECACPAIAKSYAAIACAALIVRLPVRREFVITVEN